MSSKSTIWNLPLFAMAVALLITSSCKKDDPNIEPGPITLSGPADVAVDIALDAALSWQAVTDPDGDAITYDVYFDTEAEPTVASLGQTATSYSPTLLTNTTYYWKVVAKDGNGGTSKSQVWSFTTDLIAWSEAIHGTFTDTRDDKEYDVIKIGDQVWFVENLAYEMPGKEITDATEWGNNTAYDGWCYYDNDKATYGGTYGILYQWEAVKAACPTGWHFPTDVEWTTLTDYFGGSATGGKLKEIGTTHWANPNTGATNESGFTALPGGHRDFDGRFGIINYAGYWWSSTGRNSNAWGRYLNYNFSNIYKSSHGKELGFSVRCVRD